jgi:hypothetical protein
MLCGVQKMSTAAGHDIQDGCAYEISIGPTSPALRTAGSCPATEGTTNQHVQQHEEVRRIGNGARAFQEEVYSAPAGTGTRPAGPGEECHPGAHEKISVQYTITFVSSDFRVRVWERTELAKTRQRRGLFCIFLITPSHQIRDASAVCIE